MFPTKAKKPTPGAPKPGGPPERSGLSAPSPVEMKGAPEPADDEAGEGPPPDGESPDLEQTDSSGVDIVADLAAVGQSYGADPETSRELAADFLDALSKCVRGKKQEETFDVGEPEMGVPA